MVPAYVQAAPPAQAAPDRAEAYYLFLRGRQFEGEGRIDEAIAAHRRALALEPGSAEIRAELAGLLARQNRGKEALAEAQAALAIDPENREAHRILGYVFTAMVDGNPAGESAPESVENARKAAAHFEKARAGRAPDPASELTLGRLYVITGEFDRAISTLRDFLLDQPGYTEAILLLSDAYAGKGDTDEAIAALEQVMQAGGGQGGQMARPAIRLAELYETRGRWQDAAGVYERVMRESPRMAPVLRARRATALVNAGRLDEARAILREITAADPRDAGAWYLLSQTELRAGMLGDAEQAARRVLALDAADPRGGAALADVLVARREFPRALETLEPWLARDSDRDAFELIAPRAAHVLGEMGRHDRAIEMLERLAKQLPDDTDLKFELGAAYERARRHADAERVFREIVVEEPRHALALNYLGYMLADRGERLEEAVSLISRALEIDPGNPSFHDSLGWAYYRQRRYDLAETHLARAAKGSPDSSVVLDHYGDALFALKRTADAIAAWEKALAGDRDDVDVAQIQKKIALAKNIR